MVEHEWVVIDLSSGRILTRELEVAVQAARAGGEALRRSYGALDSVRYKGPVDLVTEADEESERVVTIPRSNMVAPPQI